MNATITSTRAEKLQKLRSIYDNVIQRFLNGELPFYSNKLFANITFDKFVEWYDYAHNIK